MTAPRTATAERSRGCGTMADGVASVLEDIHALDGINALAPNTTHDHGAQSCPPPGPTGSGSTNTRSSLVIGVPPILLTVPSHIICPSGLSAAADTRP